MTGLTGQTIAGCDIISELGHGGMGAVYKARQAALDRFVAVKVMSPQLADDADYTARFKREAAIAAQLHHQNMVLVHSAGEEKGLCYIIMEFVEGCSLHEHIERHGRLAPLEALAITVHIAQALQYAWNKSKLIHRDIKPANIFLSHEGEVKVGDLGLAKSVGQSTTGLTQTGAAMGSPHYIAPEQARGIREIDFRSDIYSLGCTLYHMLTGQPPYSGTDAMSIMMKHVSDPPPAIFTTLPGCPMPLGMLVGKMLSKKPAARHQSYEDLIAELYAVTEKIEAASVQATAALAQPAAVPAAAVSSAAPAKMPTQPQPKPVTPTVRESKPVTRGSRLVMGGTVAVAVLLLAGLFFWSPWKGEKNEQGRREGAKPGSESRLQAESVPAQPAKAGTPNVVASADEAAWQNAINLLPLVDLGKDAVEGEWVLENGALRHKTEAVRGRLQIPYQPPEEYDFRIVFAAQIPWKSIWQILRGGGRTFQLVIGGLKPGANARCLGFEIINGKSAGENPSGVLLTPDLKIGRNYTSLVQVRKDGVRLFLDDRFMTEWKTDYQDMTMFNSNRLRDDRLLGIADSAGSFFHSIELREVTGKGTFMRAAASGPSTPPAPKPSVSSSGAVVSGTAPSSVASSGFKVLFDGCDTSAWLRSGGSRPCHWEARDGDLIMAGAHIETREKFQDFELHLEFLLPRNIGEGDSGIFLQNRYEVNIRDSFGKATSDDNCGALFQFRAPSENASKPPGEWQSFDITFYAARFDAAGAKTANARINIIHNGRLIHDNVEMPRNTLKTDPESAAPGPIRLQSYNSKISAGPIRFRNITIKPLAAATGTPGETKLLDLGGGVKMELVYVPPGEFMLGSTKEEKAWALAATRKEGDVKCEGDAPRKATIKQGFWMGRTEVTVGHWKQFVKESGYRTDAEKAGFADNVWDRRKDSIERNVKGASWRDPGFDQEDSHPVCCVSWNDAMAFCAWQTEREKKAGQLAQGHAVRLPTEAEWEYACRAGTQTKYWWGDTPKDGEGRLNWNGGTDGFRFASPADHYGARGRNGFGLADMLGNAQEWCLDSHDAAGAHEEYWKTGAARVLKGGTFTAYPTDARCAVRSGRSPSHSHFYNGFRVVVGVAR